MVNPSKVLAFLDASGSWDPSFAFVMGGALAITIISFKIVLGGARPVFDTIFNIPDRTAVDLQLVSGASIFGIGWGLVGLCPGPAIAALAYGRSESFVFLAALFAGFFIEKINPIGSLADQS